MGNRYPFWLRTTAALQLIASAVHALNFFRTTSGINETERQLNELMTTYRPDMGPYFHPTTADLNTGLSACYSLLYLLGGMINLYLVQKNISPQIMKGLTSINLVVFGVSFLVMLNFMFLPPIIMTGLVFIGLCFAYATNHIHRIKLPKD